MSTVLRLVRLDYDLSASLREDPVNETVVATFVGDTDHQAYVKLDGYVREIVRTKPLYRGGDALWPQFRVQREVAQ